MPIRYDIAAGVPQGQSFSPMNMLAQMQQMDYRDQQNALAQMQMAEYQRKLQADMATRALGGEAGFNIADPRLVGRAVQLGGLEEGVRIANLQRQLEALRAQEEAQRAAAESTRGQLRLSQREFEELKLPKSQLEAARERRMAEQAEASAANIRAEQALRERRYGEIELPKSQLEAVREQRLAEQAAASAEESRGRMRLAEREFEELKLPKSRLEAKKLGFEAAREEREGKKLEFEINKEQLDRDAKVLERFENQAAKIYNMNGRGYENFRSAALRENEVFGKMLPEQYDANALAGFIETAGSTRDRLKSASDYELREIQSPDGSTRVVAILKKAPQMGAIPVPGAAGAKPADYGFMPGPPDTGLVTRTNPRTGLAELITPVQPGQAAVAQPGAAQPAIGRLIPSEIRPTAEAPVGSAAYNNKRFATEVLDASGFNAETGNDRVSELIRKSTSGGLQTRAAGVRGFFGGASPGMEAIGEIKTIINDAILKKLDGKLGAGISNEDREFIKSTLGNLDDPNIPANQRLASWNSAKRVLMKYANTGQSAASANRPSLDEIFK